MRALWMDETVKRTVHAQGVAGLRPATLGRRVPARAYRVDVVDTSRSKIRLALPPDDAGGFVVTSPDLPELVTEGETAEEALAAASDAIAAVRELYEDLRKPWPS